MRYSFANWTQVGPKFFDINVPRKALIVPGKAPIGRRRRMRNRAVAACLDILEHFCPHLYTRIFQELFALFFALLFVEVVLCFLQQFFDCARNVFQASERVREVPNDRVPVVC